MMTDTLHNHYRRLRSLQVVSIGLLVAALKKLQVNVPVEDVISAVRDDYTQKGSSGRPR